MSSFARCTVWAAALMALAYCVYDYGSSDVLAKASVHFPKKSRYSRGVFNLEVESEHDFLVNEIIAHNHSPKRGRKKKTRGSSLTDALAPVLQETGTYEGTKISRSGFGLYYDRAFVRLHEVPVGQLHFTYGPRGEEVNEHRATYQRPLSSISPTNSENVLAVEVDQHLYVLKGAEVVEALKLEGEATAPVYIVLPDSDSWASHVEGARRIMVASGVLRTAPLPNSPSEHHVTDEVRAEELVDDFYRRSRGGALNADELSKPPVLGKISASDLESYVDKYWRVPELGYSKLLELREDDADTSDSILGRESRRHLEKVAKQRPAAQRLLRAMGRGALAVAPYGVVGEFSIRFSNGDTYFSRPGVSFVASLKERVFAAASPGRSFNLFTDPSLRNRLREQVTQFYGQKELAHKVRNAHELWYVYSAPEFDLSYANYALDPGTQLWTAIRNTVYGLARPHTIRFFKMLPVEGRTFVLQTTYRHTPWGEGS